ncbi:MAG TPA: GNAT family N-acetyltransferase [Gaiellaceae bacterium]|nr:GNAT family N-acetyltransferase [Gaiellaceae bacterium]
MAFRVRTVRDLEEFRAAVGSIGHYFGWQPTEEDGQRFSRLLPPERLHAALDDGRIVAGAGVFPFELTVPGGPLRCAGVTVVGVLPSHRRRGLLTRLMRAQLEDMRECGEPIAGLWASEETIYGRYGYGLASFALRARVPRVWGGLAAGLPPREGRIRLVDHEEAMRLLPPAYERLRRRTVGFLSRPREWWELRRLDDDPERRFGAGPLNRAVLELDGRVAGWALYRVQQDNRDGHWRRNIRVAEAFGDGPAATREVWRFLLEIDWVDEVHAWMLPVDHPLRLVVARVNQLGLRLEDGLWVRLVDVGAALSAREYAADGRVTLEVATDPHVPDNAATWTLEDGVARRSRRRPDVRLGVDALGATYLGGVSFAELAAAGRVEEASRGGLARADALFRTPAAPWCPENF